MTREGRIMISIGILALAIAFFAWQYPHSKQSNDQSNSNKSSPVYPDFNSPQNENGPPRVRDNNGNNNTPSLRNSNGNNNTPAPPPPVGKVLARYEERGVLIECTLCKMDGNFVTCEFLLENESQGARDIWLFTTDYYDKGSRMYDESNNEYKTSVIQIGNRDNGERGYTKILAVPHQKIRAAIKFKEVDPQIKSISLLRIRVGVAKPDQHIYGDLDQSFEARMGGKIPIAK